MVFNLELGKMRHSGQWLALPETFQGFKSFQIGRRCEGHCLIIVLIIISRTRVRSYYNGHKYMDFIFKVMVQQSITCRSLIYWIGGFTYLYQSKYLSIRDGNNYVWANPAFLDYSIFFCFSLIIKKEERNIKRQLWVINGCVCLCCQRCQLL